MRIAVVALAAALAGCAAQPQQTVVQLDQTAPKYASEECRAARQTALAYNDNSGSRMGAGLALGFLLGPFGIPLAMALDAGQDSKRQAINTELTKHCGGNLLQSTFKVVPAKEIGNPTSTACSQGAAPC